MLISITTLLMVIAIGGKDVVDYGDGDDDGGDVMTLLVGDV